MVRWASLLLDLTCVDRKVNKVDAEDGQRDREEASLSNGVNHTVEIQPCTRLPTPIPG